jgi:hypothetical protein
MPKLVPFIKHVMPQQQDAQLAEQEGRITIALLAF